MVCASKGNVKLTKVKSKTICEVCRRTFIKEKMWTTNVFAPILFGDSVKRFYCAKCCPTSEYVTAIAQSLEDKKHELPPIDE